MERQNQLSKMYVLAENAFKKWLESTSDAKTHSALDNEMKKILFNKKLDSATKWYLYRQQLVKYADFKRQSSKGKVKVLSGEKKSDVNRFSQTDPVDRSDKQLQTDYISTSHPGGIDQFIQTDPVAGPEVADKQNQRYIITNEIGVTAKPKGRSARIQTGHFDMPNIYSDEEDSESYVENIPYHEVYSNEYNMPSPWRTPVKERNFEAPCSALRTPNSALRLSFTPTHDLAQGAMQPRSPVTSNNKTPNTSNKKTPNTTNQKITAKKKEKSSKKGTAPIQPKNLDAYFSVVKSSLIPRRSDRIASQSGGRHRRHHYYRGTKKQSTFKWCNLP